jgi:hypothetical protein
MALTIPVRDNSFFICFVLICAVSSEENYGCTFLGPSA